MKKDVTETRTFCDFCEEPGYTQCVVCDKDLCPKHRLGLLIYLDRQDRTYRASFCLQDAQPLEPFLVGLVGKSNTWQKAGVNPEYNEGRLREVLNFLRKAAPVK